MHVHPFAVCPLKFAYTLQSGSHTMSVGIYSAVCILSILQLQTPMCHFAYLTFSAKLGVVLLTRNMSVDMHPSWTIQSGECTRVEGS